ncbi:MAG: peptidylprolyl isomerase [Planctomycetota bacterium]
MSDSSNDSPAIAPAAVPGQITQPNPLELLWERHRRSILGALLVLGLVIAGYYVMDYLQRQERNRRWDLFAQGNQLRELYAPEEDPTLDPLQYWAFTTSIHWDSKLGDLVKDLESLSAAELADTASKLEDGPGALWCEWVLACKHAAAGRIEEAEQSIERIKAKDPDFPLLRKRNSPPVYVPLPEKTEKTELAADDSPAEEPKPPVPEPAALTDLLLGKARKDLEFRKANPALYAAPEPDAKPEVVLATKLGPIRIRVYADRAPKHVANFLDVCKSGYYKGLRFHRVERKGTGKQSFGSRKTAQLAYLGHPDSKADDRSKWEKSSYSEEQTPFEDSRLSHFPFMVAADREPGKRGSDQRLIYITANDCAAERDGQYVVFGKVVEGTEIISQIVGAELFSAAEESSGSGRPKESFQISDVKVIE